ncbi:MAG TPA: DUF6498-containing protein [bacterium]|nr:DUF6498-containing protein [bacterium]
MNRLRMDFGLVPLLLANGMPLIGYFLWHWLPVDLLFLFWVETLFLFLTALAAAFSGPKSPPNLSNLLGGVIFTGWFLLIFLMFVCAMDPRMDGMEKRDPFLVVPRLFWQDQLWIQVLVLALSYSSQWVMTVIHPAPDPGNPDPVLRDLLAPTGRLAALFFAILLGLFTTRALPNYSGVFFVLLAIKTLGDSWIYFRKGSPRSAP